MQNKAKYYFVEVHTKLYQVSNHEFEQELCLNSQES
jgi:hypothetical protein